METKEALAVRLVTVAGYISCWLHALLHPGVKILLIAGGIALVIWQPLERINAIALYEAAGGYADNDVTRRVIPRC